MRVEASGHVSTVTPQFGTGVIRVRCAFYADPQSRWRPFWVERVGVWGKFRRSGIAA
jgi:hypothetical protein